MLLSIWLTSENQTLINSIQELAKEEKTFVFYPHITLINQINLKDKKEEEIKKILENLSTSIKTFLPFTLQIKEIQTSEIFTKTLFLTFHASDKLNKIRKIAENILLKNNFHQFNRDFSPHLSLIYKNLSQERKNQLLKKISRSLPTEIDFNDLLVIKEEKPIENPEDIQKWQYIRI